MLGMVWGEGEGVSSLGRDKNCKRTLYWLADRSRCTAAALNSLLHCTAVSSLRHAASAHAHNQRYVK